MVKRTAWSEYALNKSSFQAAKVNDGDRIIAVQPYTGGKDTTMFFVTKNGMGLNAKTDDIPLQGRISAGVKGISLKGDDEVVFVSQIDNEGEIIVVNSENKFKRIIASQFEPSVRYRKGNMVMSLKENESIIFADYVTNPYMISVKNKDGSFSLLSSEDISIEPSSSKGRKIRLRDDINAERVFALKYFPDKEL